MGGRGVNVTYRGLNNTPERQPSGAGLSVIDRASKLPDSNCRYRNTDESEAKESTDTEFLGSGHFQGPDKI